ncbi:hypothetical protein GWO43_07620 [candidate division KSB1 bacterium]|nr:hypothetical protein [candidate division KSB1 bacterium]NIR72528.1 hypothetical protein [candidate division KSB1 bacterium]NIS23827.1 hypothetical protein [candidate division KSB1 bacterium]NIT70754.1 hypothetical protein [candidate division KSB1 bacterium]NIU24269.1 hypothetical protein [candidate division KSB1 bacterium]
MNVKIATLCIGLIVLIHANGCFHSGNQERTIKPEPSKSHEQSNFVRPHDTRQSWVEENWTKPKPDMEELAKTSSIETLRGQILSVDTVTIVKDMAEILHVMVETDEEIVPVYLGPKWIFEMEQFDIKTGSDVVIKGYRVDIGAYRVMLTLEIETGGQKRVLRNRDGVPLWGTILKAEA